LVISAHGHDTTGGDKIPSISLLLVKRATSVEKEKKIMKEREENMA